MKVSFFIILVMIFSACNPKNNPSNNNSPINNGSNNSQKLSLQERVDSITNAETEINSFFGNSFAAELNAIKIATNEQDKQQALTAFATKINNDRNTDGDNLLHTAASNGYEKIVQALLAAGAKIDIQNSFGLTALHKAALGGKENIIKALLEAGAKTDIQDSNSDTALHIAADQGNEKIVKALLGAGAKTDIQSLGDTPLHLAAEKGHEKIVQVLLAAGADKSIKNTDNKTAADIATTTQIKDLINNYKKP